MSSPTEIQWLTIRRIEESLGVKFSGTSRKEASRFIGENIDESSQTEWDEECKSYGLPNL